jgi:DNA-3-methyladenine glycosylase II
MTLTPIRSAKDLELALGDLVALEPRFASHATRARPLPLREASPGFAALARIIVSQQVSATAAEAIWRRLEGVIGEVTPQSFLNAGPEAWREGGLSRPKQKTIAASAEAVLDKQFDLETLCYENAETAIEAMTKVWGVGRWTAEVYLLFAGGHPDVFPARDLALQIGLQECFDLEARPDEKTAIAMTNQWAPLRSVAARLIWAIYGLNRQSSAGLPI